MTKLLIKPLIIIQKRHRIVKKRFLCAFFSAFFLSYWKKAVPLQRVFHGIRFILRLVKIGCRDDNQFFLHLTGIFLRQV
ncbi:MAG: hypothetical protein IJ901_05355 [Bacteroidaceae bacterium]|nr:hypothetical protein [Bacteroidaceae bacterium]